MQAEIARRRIALISLVFLAFCTTEVVLFLNHLSFRDEAQAWLWVLEFKNWRDYFVIPYEGHPPVWYWILKLLSLGFSFNQARWLAVILAIVNGALLIRLVGHRPVLFVLVLTTQFFMIFWGFFFRPYGLVLTLLLCALLAHRARRPVLGTWILAIACGLHFFAGFIFALWLLFQLRARVPVRWLIWPALLALGFGLSAVLSALGNPRGELVFDDVLAGALHVFALSFKLSEEPWQIWVIVMGAMISIAFWRDKYLLAALILSIAAFCLFGQVVYGIAEWHFGFVPVLVLTAFLLNEDKVRAWPIAVLMVPQTINGLLSAGILTVLPYSLAERSYEAVKADAGDALDPETNLISWPDFVLSAPSALNDFKFISGNTGKVIGPSLYSEDRPEDRQPNKDLLVQTQTPYWLVCFHCDDALTVIESAGLFSHEVFPPTEGNHKEAVAAYRVDRE